MAYSVTQRYHEIGIRMAMGAEVSNILLMVMKKGFYLTSIGLFIGLVGSLLVSKAVASMLYGVSAIDPLTYMAVSFLLMMITLLACYLPARRAAKVDPMTALRYE
jgi:putative ABC transport system permease protein